ncbi:unnamed protein product [Bursaphelenchus xylophilus]|uniref:(pine wood nematode) hypothetical protein n=1 Tax=Bursaphelenchus xylophilus TaxID=6326 RepID=A0A7I8XJZ7_BURXY|nr:unnamed protein product [Bursaphelenchus xylophilus]CAG9118389.1 unnamed protein product [Bursaphelenchus xylophilus]
MEDGVEEKAWSVVWYGNMHKGFDLTHFGMGFIHLNLKFAVTVDAPEYDAIPTAHLAFHTSQMSMAGAVAS